jgi:hypothetical protein
VRMHSAGPGGWPQTSPERTTVPFMNTAAAAATGKAAGSAANEVDVAGVAVSARVASAQVGLVGLASLAVRVGLAVSAARSAADDVAASAGQVAADAVTSVQPSSRCSPRNPATDTS